MTPVITQIMDAIGARLANISAANGYNTTQEKIERARLSPFQAGDTPAINYWYDIDTLDKSGGGFEYRNVDVLIEYHDKTRDRPFTDVAAELSADVWAALWRDVSAPAVTDPVSSTLGGLVKGMKLQEAQPQIGEGQTPYCGVLMRVSISYVRRPENPFVI